MRKKRIRTAKTNGLKLSKRIDFKKYRPGKKYENIKWDFHPQDVDYWPSIPHGHSIDSPVPLKLDIFTGEIYETNSKKKIGIVKSKDLRELCNDKKFKKMEIRANEFFEVHNPDLYRRLGYPKRDSIKRRIVIISTLLNTFRDVNVENIVRTVRYMKCENTDEIIDFTALDSPHSR